MKNRWGKVNTCTHLFHLGKALKLRIVVDSDACKNILKMFAILSVKHLHCAL